MRKLRITIFGLALVLVLGKGNAQDVEDGIVKYKVSPPSEVRVGSKFQIDVIFTVKPDWYIYAPNGLNAELGKIETKVVFISNGLPKTGVVKIPTPSIKDGHKVYEGDSIVMSQTFSATFKPGRYEIKGKITYQTCNSDICLPPVTEDIVAIVNVKK